MLNYQYEAFISYRSATSAKAARALRRALQALGKRHRPDHELSIFFDIQSLAAGELSAEIKRALEASRCLVVLLAVGTRESRWVSEEIDYWLHHGGSRERLFLVRHDAKLNLTWNNSAGNFAAPEDLPDALSGVFSSEQKWLNLETSMWGIDETSMVGLYAPLVQVSPQDLLLAEAEFQQRRIRRTRSVVAAIALLLVLTLIAGVTATLNWSRANREAQQARADANAAQALLSVDASPAQGISNVLSAAHDSPSLSVRAALLAVANSTTHLRAAFDFPSDKAGYSAKDVAFSSDNQSLFAWGQGSKDSFLARWNMLTLDRDIARRIDVTGLNQLDAIADDWAVACSDSGPVRIAMDSGNIEKLEAKAAPNDPCWTTHFDSGIIVGYEGPSAPNGRVHFIDNHGNISTVDDADEWQARSGRRTAVVAGRSGISVLSSAGVNKISSDAALGAAFSGTDGSFAVQMSDRSWRLVRPDGIGGYRTYNVTPRPDAIASYPRIEHGILTGGVAEMLPGGQVGIVGQDTVISLSALPTDDGGSFPPTIRTLSDGSIVAIYGYEAFLVWPPGVVAYPTEVKDLARDTWRQLKVPYQLKRYRPGGGPLAQVCPSHDVLVLSGSGSPIVIGSGTDPIQQVDSLIGLTHECIVMSNDHGALQVRQGNSSTPTMLRGNPTWDALAPASNGDLAIMRRNQPIEVFASADLNRPWGQVRDIDGASAALGERRIAQSSTGHLVVSAADGSREVWRTGTTTSISAVHPAGTDAVVKQGKTTVIESAHDSAPVAERCTDQEIGYVPSQGFSSNVAAADTPVIIAQTPTGLIDCRTGNRVTTLAPANIIEYGIGKERGEILWRNAEGQLRTTTWNVGDDQVTTVAPPPEFEDQGSRFSFSGVDRGVGVEKGSRVITTVARDDGRWRTIAQLNSALPDIVGVALADGDTLAVAVAKDGTFEIFDTATGRKVITFYGPQVIPLTVENISTEVSDGTLWIRMNTENSPSIVQVPISSDLLVAQLCSVYVSAEC